MDGATKSHAATAGDVLLRNPTVMAARDAVLHEVREQLAAALHGPIGTALAASAPGGHDVSDGPPSQHVQAQALLGAEIPRRFLATGAALTIAYSALATGDEVRVGGALLAVQGLLFPNDALGFFAVQTAVRLGLEATAPADGDPGGPVSAAATADAAADMQRRVEGDIERLDRAYLGVLPHLTAAALGSPSWRTASGGAGPASGVLSGPLALFLEGLLRWTFYLCAALDGVRRDDWTRTGAALVAARRVTSTAG